MRVVKKLTRPETFLRLGFGLTLLYSGYNIYTNPNDWIGFINDLPPFLIENISRLLAVEQFLAIQGVFEMILAGIFLIPFMPKALVKFGALFLSAHMALILYFVGIDLVTFRDVGLLGASLALFSIYTRR